ncbi:MAG: monofunctional biosynthetic peptidoglycan transglycosylase [Bdellovibrionota bacterium]
MSRFAILLACSAGFFFLVFLGFRSATDVGELRTRYPRVLYDPQTETAKVEVVKQRPTGWVSLQNIAPIAWNAVVISEDAAFWTHNGFDWNQMWDAFETNLKQHKFARGGSTITQQVIKNVYLTKEKTVLRKAKEAFLTMRIERHVSKKRILEIYLNIAEFGPGVYGIGHASQYYFQKDPSRLNAKEGAFLAILLPSPKRYSVSFRKKALTPFARDAIRGVLEKLKAVKKLSEPEFEAAISTPMGFEATQMAAPAQAPEDEDQAPEEEQETPTEGVSEI